MNATTYTPGPWRATRKGGSVLAGAQPLALIVEGDERLANARLMAAAPDLLAACVYALSALSLMDADEGSAADRIRAAIARAKGSDQ